MVTLITHGSTPASLKNMKSNTNFNLDSSPKTTLRAAQNLIDAKTTASMKVAHFASIYFILEVLVMKQKRDLKP